MEKRPLSIMIAVCLLSMFSAVGGPDTAYAVPPNRATYDAFPPFITNTPPPLVMLVMGKNHKMFYEAYNDASDLDEDGKIDVGYKPDAIDYYGYFDSFKSYQYNGASGQFEPVAVISDKKVTPGSGLWSGDFLNYLTMSRMDAIRKVLYGGYRVTDTASETVLERAYIPQDAHSWGKEYESVARDGYDIRDYAPLDLPPSTPIQTRHLFASTSLYPATDANYKPLLRVLDNSVYRVWEWVSIERPVAGDNCLNGSTTCTTGGGTTWMTVADDASMGLSNVTQTFYDTSGSSIPGSHGAYDTFVTTYAVAGRLQGSQPVNTINGSGNPFDGDGEYYMSLFDGTLNIAADDTYTFAVDGDDAVELLIDITGDGDFDDANEVVAGWYGGHGSCNCNTHSGSVALTAGSYTFQFRHQEATGGDNYYLRWQVTAAASTMTDYRVRVKVGVSGLEESNCKKYPDGNFKPIGLLQRKGESDSMYFGLISGSYDHNMAGGVLRKKMGSITDEIDPDNGVFTPVSGIIDAIDHFRILDFNYSGGYYYNGGWVTTRPMNENEFPDWGNPIGEMMYESLRYFAGKGSPTTDYSSGAMPDDTAVGLASAAWDDPYNASTGYPGCAKPFMLVISDINPTFDSDQLPGSAYGSFSGDLAGLDVESLGQTIGVEEGISGSYYIGDHAGTTDSSCSAMSISGLGDIRGLCPEEPTKQGSYYSASVAYYGRTQDISAMDEEQKVASYMVGMASPLPRIEIMLGDQPVTMVPFAKSVGGCAGVDPNISFQPTNTIVDFYVETLDPDDPTYGKFRINYEDVEQGADHDMDAIVEYTFQVYQSDGVTPAVTAGDGTNNGTMVKITLNSTYAAGCIIQHMGYIISGTTTDGTYLDVRDLDTASGSDVDYWMDTPDVPGALPVTATRTFYPGTTTAASLLKDPFWYAAKWGAFSDINGNDMPDLQDEWDKDHDGVPDTYYYVTNPLRLEQQLNRSFADIASSSSSGTAAAVVANNSEGQGTMLQAFFKPVHLTKNNVELNWLGHLRSLWVDQFGHLREDSNHDFKFNYTTDKIVEYGTDGSGNAFVHRYLQHYHYDPDNEFDEKCVISSCATSYETIGIDDIESLFSAGELLHQQAASDRQIFTFIDGDGVDNDGDSQIDQSGEVEGAKFLGQVLSPFSDAFTDALGEVVAFDITAADRLKPFLGLKDDAAFSYLETGGPDYDTRVANLINYIRGVDSSGLIGQPATRSRTEDDGNVWKLGDIVRSTPISVAGPIDNYDLIYSDESYLDYIRQYADRETMVYAGANDGMLHAFTHGKYTFDSGTGEYGYEIVDATPIGQELWAYIPQSLLPHLKWLADPSYAHSFYVDLQPKVFDARIFTPDADHPRGWGTLLLGGLGHGGKEIWAEGDFDANVATADVERKFYSSYFCIDITNPRTPRLLWERSYENLGLTTSFPSILQVGATYDGAAGQWNAGKWYAVMGSGPHDAAGMTDYNGYSDQNGYIFVVDLLTGELLRRFDTGWPQAVMAAAASLDKASDSSTGPVSGLTYNVDAVYIGGASYSGTPGDFSGRIFKINTRYGGDVPSDNPNDWSLSTLFDTDRPITAAPTLSVDTLDNAWVFFGTGRFQEMNDRVTTRQQYLYGIKDPYFNKQYDSSDSANYNGLGNYYHNNTFAETLSRGRLFHSNPYESNDNTNTVTPLSGGLGYISDWKTLLSAARNTDQSVNSDYFDGWYRELDPRLNIALPSERVISKPALLGGLVFAPIYIPDDDICGFGGGTDIYGVYYETGTPYWRHVFNKDTATPGDLVQYRSGVLLNTGPPPPTLSMHIGRQSGAKIFSQTGLGPVLEINISTSVPESDVLYWNEP
jgi:type IV pilus assembly protein PilY1